MTDVGIPTAPLCDPQSGEVTPAWRRFLMSLLARTGGSPGPGTAPATVLTPAASPFVYAPGIAGTLFVSGGGVEAMTVRRRAGTAYPVGHFYGAFPLAPTDSVSITYLSAPQLVFFPE
jgi:hypothetical protein